MRRILKVTTAIRIARPESHHHSRHLKAISTGSYIKSLLENLKPLDAIQAMRSVRWLPSDEQRDRS